MGNITLLKLIANAFVPVLVILIGGCQPAIPVEIELAYASLPEQVDFNFHIRPILSDRCYKCHGPDDEAREAGLRLDVEENAFAQLRESRGHAFVKNKPWESIAWRRILADDPDYQMPPPESNLSLSAREKALIIKWIEQGAEWKRHWSYNTPEKIEVPAVLPASWNRFNAIDHFIQDELLQQGLSPSPLASKERLIRRLSFDLWGLPPSQTEIDDFLADQSPDAYENLVDHFLLSEAHAERLAMEWMDVSRYADSHGLHADGLRIMWPWRDWVISAFHKNLAHDKFILWQIAGDLLLDATQEQKLATGFYRNQPLNSELGIVNEEFRLKYVADRTNTTGTAFLGLTLECASCHDHKFDPISQKEYYQLTSFFNNVHELGMIGNDKNFGPLLLLPEQNVKDSIALLVTQINELENRRDLHKEEILRIKNYLEIDAQKIAPPAPIGFYPLESIQPVKPNKGKPYFTCDNNQNLILNGNPEPVPGQLGNAVRIDNDYENILIGGLKHFDLHDSFSAGAWIKTEKSGTFQSIIGNIGDKNTGWRGWIFFLDSMQRPGLKLVHSLSHNYIHIRARNSIKKQNWSQLFFTYDGSGRAAGIKIYANGIALDCEILFDNLYKNIRPIKHRNYTPDPERKLRMGIGTKYLFSETDDGTFVGCIDQVRVYDLELSPLEINLIFQQDSGIDLLSSASDTDLASHYLLRKDPNYQDLSKILIKVRRQKQQLLDPVQEVMVMEEMPEPRKTHVLERGQYDEPGEIVTAKTPSAILPFPDHLPKNRLGLAQWLLDRDHPLTARVIVNRYWQMIFGRAIVSTPHDFGIQGALPSHPELLDWLAVEFQEDDWDLRALIKLMVMSVTYRQSSVMTEESSNDPENIFLSRGPSHRLQMEMIRDNALASSGLINRKVGGPSVKPYQPDGLWKEKNEFSGFLQVYHPDTGQDLYRRSLYTFIRRTSPPPVMTTFDMPSRDICVVTRERTNTPLQALALMNEPLFMEASKALAIRMQKVGNSTVENMISFAFRQLCGRDPTNIEKAAMLTQYRIAHKKFSENPDNAAEVLTVGEYPFPDDLDPIETASLALVANMIMNFDEAYMKR